MMLVMTVSPTRLACMSGYAAMSCSPLHADRATDESQSETVHGWLYRLARNVASSISRMSSQLKVFSVAILAFRLAGVVGMLILACCVCAVSACALLGVPCRDCDPSSTSLSFISCIICNPESSSTIRAMQPAIGWTASITSHKYAVQQRRTRNGCMDMTIDIAGN